MKRLRVYLTLVGVTLWTIWAIDFSVAGNTDRLGKVKGTDFLHFYVIGSVVRDGRWDELYDVQAQHVRARQLAPSSNETLFLPIESPQMAVAFAPLAALPYTAALTVWLLASLALYAASCVALWRDSTGPRVDRGIVMWAAIASPGFYTAVLFGQTSCVSLACTAAALVALRRSYAFVAGLALGCLVFKPHWVAAAGLVFFFAREWRVVAGAIVGALVQLAVTLAVVGPSVMTAYVRALRSLPRIAALLEPHPSDSLKGVFQVLVPNPATSMVLFVATAMAALMIASEIWRSRAAFEVRCSALVMAMLLINPHVGAYDLVLLTPLYFWLATRLEPSFENRRDLSLAVLLGVAFVAPVVTNVPATVRLVCSVGSVGLALMVLRCAPAVSDVSDSSSIHLGDGMRVAPIGRGRLVHRT